MMVFHSYTMLAIESDQSTNKAIIYIINGDMLWIMHGLEISNCYPEIFIDKSQINAPCYICLMEMFFQYIIPIHW